MFMRCGVILIVRVFFYIFTPLITTTTRLHLTSSHRRHCLRACQHVRGRCSRGPDVALAQSGRCERVPRRSSNEHSPRRIIFLCLFGGQSAATAVTPPMGDERTAPEKGTKEQRTNNLRPVCSLACSGSLFDLGAGLISSRRWRRSDLISSLAPV